MKDIVVTGMGVLTAAGICLEDFWQTLYRGQNVYGVLDELSDDANYRIKIGAKVKSQAWSSNLPPHIKDQYGKAACYSVSTALRAIDDAGIDMKQLDGDRVAVVIGTTMGEIETEEEITRRICAQEEISPLMYRQYHANNIPKAVAEAVGARGKQYAVLAACAAGNYAVGMAKKLLDWGEADMVIVGGVDVFSYVAFAGFQRLLSLTPDLCRPFDLNRKGLVLGEGCGIVILEREKERRHQRILGRILGVGLASNAFQMTAPHKNGEGEMAAMKKAIEDAGLMSTCIDHISAHGTGTRLNDKIESQAINSLFGDSAPDVSSIKSTLGHSMGAASMLELIASLQMIEKDIVLPTANIETMDTQCNIDVVSGKPRQRKLEYLLSNSFAFGGQTSSIVIGA